MNRDQKIVAVGAVSGIASMLLATWGLTSVLPVPAAATAADRLAYALPWQALAVAPLFAMVVAIGNARFASDAIDPTRGAESQAMVINGRVADNTLQQFVIFLAASLALAVTVPENHLQVVGAAAIVFTAARILFWIGYRIDPLYRAFGFSSTAYLNFGMLLAVAWFALF